LPDERGNRKNGKPGSRSWSLSDTDCSLSENSPQAGIAARRKLKLATPGDRVILMIRDFAAPRSLLFEAWTTPALLKRWRLGPGGYSQMLICEIDLNLGGSYRYLWRNNFSGREMALLGIYRQISGPERLVTTEKFDQTWSPGESLVTTMFTEKKDGTTTMRTTVLCESREMRHRMLKSCSWYGGDEASFNWLDRVLVEEAQSGL
jgi:uncharacterized protein YndB with AHSA1/START domain